MSLSMGFKAPIGESFYPKSIDIKEKVNSPKDFSLKNKTNDDITKIIEDITTQVENLTFNSDSKCNDPDSDYDDPTPVVINGASYIPCEFESKDDIPEDIMIYIFEELKSSDLKLITRGKKKGYYKFSPKSMKNPIYIKLEKV
jgi:hypothetical protein